MISLYLPINSRCPHIMDDIGFSHVVLLSILLVATPNYIHNPYLLAKIVEVCKIFCLLLFVYIVDIFNDPWCSGTST